MWVTVLASQPSVGMATETTHRTSAPSALLPTGVHDLAEQVLVGEGVGVGAGVALAELGALKASISAAAAALKSAFIASPDSQLSGVDEDRALGVRTTRLRVDVGEVREPSRGIRGGAVVSPDIGPGDPVVDELADRRVGAKTTMKTGVARRGRQHPAASARMPPHTSDRGVNADSVRRAWSTW